MSVFKVFTTHNLIFLLNTMCHTVTISFILQRKNSSSGVTSIVRAELI